MIIIASYTSTFPPEELGSWTQSWAAVYSDSSEGKTHPNPSSHIIMCMMVHNQGLCDMQLKLGKKLIV